jgi:outer membrane protein
LKDIPKSLVEMKKIILIILTFYIAISFNISGQEKLWTLEDCINYAVSNNIGLQRQVLQTETSQANLLKSKMDLLPSLNLGSDARIGFGRSIDPVTNLITFKQNISNSYSLNSNLQLFNGFAALNTVAANRFMYMAGLENEKIVRNNLVLQILGQYYQVIYSKGLENASRLRLELSENQLFRIRKLVETGREAVSRQLEMESQVSADKLSLTIAQNTASQDVTTLKQMLQLDTGAKFDINIPDLDQILIRDQRYDTDSIYQIASQVLPRLKAIDYELRASRKQIAAAKGSVSPSISVGGAIYTGFYKVIGEDVGEQASFSDQMKNNNSQAIYMSLSVPLFNNYTLGRNIRLAKIRKDDNELKLELEKNALYTEIENVCLNYNRGKDEYSAAESNLEYNRKSYDAVEKKFEAGLVDVTIFAASKTAIYNAEIEEIRTKLQLIIRNFAVQFYSTGEYDKIILN